VEKIIRSNCVDLKISSGINGLCGSCQMKYDIHSPYSLPKRRWIAAIAGAIFDRVPLKPGGASLFTHEAPDGPFSGHKKVHQVTADKSSTAGHKSLQIVP
jgi:hypothetical protein